jgi:hypothetical protein
VHVFDIWETRALFGNVFALFASGPAQVVTFICNTAAGERLNNVGTLAHWVTMSLHHSARGGVRVEVRDSQPVPHRRDIVHQIAMTLGRCGVEVLSSFPDLRHVLEALDEPGEGKDGEQINIFMNVNGEGSVRKSALFRRLQDQLLDSDHLTADRVQRQRASAGRQGDYKQIRASSWIVAAGDDIAVRCEDANQQANVWCGRVLKVQIARKSSKGSSKWKTLRRPVDLHTERQSKIQFKCVNWFEEKGTYEVPTFRLNIAIPDEYTPIAEVIMTVDFSWSDMHRNFTMPPDQWQLIRMNLDGEVDLEAAQVSLVGRPP